MMYEKLNLTTELMSNDTIAIRSNSASLNLLKKTFTNVGYRINKKSYANVKRSLNGRLGVFAFTKHNSKQVYFTNNPIHCSHCKTYLLSQFQKGV